MPLRARGNLLRPVPLLTCNHWSSRFPHLVSQPLQGSTTASKYPPACERCMHQHAEQREAAIRAQYSPEKRELNNRTEELSKVGAMAGLFVMHARDQFTLAWYDLSVLRKWEDNEVVSRRVIS